MNSFTVQIVIFESGKISFVYYWIDSNCSVKKMIFNKLQNSKKKLVPEVFVLSECQSVFFSFITKKLRHRCFPVKFANFFRTLYFVEHLQTAASGRSLLTCVGCVGLWVTWVTWVRRWRGSNCFVGCVGRVCLKFFLRE